MTAPIPPFDPRQPGYPQMRSSLGPLGNLIALISRPAAEDFQTWFNRTNASLAQNPLMQILKSGGGANLEAFTPPVTGKGAEALEVATKALKRPVRVYHGTWVRKLQGALNPKKAIETKGAVFLTDNADVAYTFTYPREYGEPMLYDDLGREVKPGKVFQYDVDLKNPMVIEGEVAQRFTDDTIFQGRLVKEAMAKGHDGIVVRDVLEGIGERYRGTTYAVFDPKALKPIR